MLQKQFHLAALLAVVLVLGFLATSVASYLLTADSLDDRIANESLPLTSDNIYSEIERDLLRLILISSLMAHDTFVRDWALDGERDPQRIIDYLREIQDKYRTSTAFFVSDATGRYYHPDGVLKTVSPDDPADAWYFRTRALSAPYEINLDHDTADRSRLSIFINYRVPDDRGGIVGVTGIGLAIDSVTALIESYQARFRRQVYFADRQGAVTLRGSRYSGGEDLEADAGPGPATAAAILAAESWSGDYERADGTRVYISSRLIPELDWYLLVEQTESEREARILGTLQLNILVALAITALVMLVAWAATRRHQRQLELMATTDSLTGAANRHLFDVIFAQEVKAADRRGEALSLMCIDIDRFKTVNDHLGHVGGDEVLVEVARLVRANIREADVLCRWGGDEFLVLMSGCDRDFALHTAERIAAAVREHRFAHRGRSVDVTLSIGIAQHRESEPLATLVERVDAAMYRSKSTGRDRVSAA